MALAAGLVDPEDLDSALGIAVSQRFKVSRHMRLDLEVTYWRKSDAAFGVPVAFRDLSVGGDALYMMPGRSLDVGIGAGVAIHRIRGEVNVGLPGETVATSTKLGIQVLGEADRRLTRRVGLFAIVRLDFVERLNQKKLMGGLRFRL